MKLIRRVSPESRDPGCGCSGHECPQVWETDTGDFVVVGDDVTVQVREDSQQDIGIGPTERAVLVPRAILPFAKER